MRLRGPDKGRVRPRPGQLHSAGHRFFDQGQRRKVGPRGRGPGGPPLAAARDRPKSICAPRITGGEGGLTPGRCPVRARLAYMGSPWGRTGAVGAGGVRPSRKQERWAAPRPCRTYGRAGGSAKNAFCLFKVFFYSILVKY